MKKILAITLAACVLAPALAQTSVGVSIGINQPGVYGRIDIGNFPQPRIIYPQPVIIAPGPVAVYQQPVYFVQEEWVRERYEERRDDRHDNDRGKDKRGKGHGKHDRED